jgi:hypothetical protein
MPLLDTTSTTANGSVFCQRFACSFARFGSFRHFPFQEVFLPLWRRVRLQVTDLDRTVQF